MRYLSLARWLICVSLVVLVGCADRSVPTTDSGGGDETTTVSSAEETTLASEPPKDEDLQRRADEESPEVDTLSVGDVAPPLQLTSWVKGSQVDAFQAGHIYVVEFWATWCGPCKAGMPHVSQLQDQYQDDVTFIGVSDENLETVEQFFASPQREGVTWDEVADYTFAIDGDQLTNRAYMTAAGQTGIPTAFVVGRDGYIEWIGHPMEIDDPLEQMVQNRWDRQLFAEEFESARAAQNALRAATSQLRSLIADENWDEAITIFDDLFEKFPGDTQIGQLRANLLINAGRASEGIAALHEVAKAHWDDPQLLNGISWVMATRIPEDVRDLDIALEIAKRANELTAQEDGSVLDTLARVYYEQGQLEQAIDWQQQAVAAGPVDPSLQKTLDKYLQERDGTSEDEEEMGEAEPADLEAPAADQTQAGDDA
jgi:thiol-disulfide isomerase/thioredoxin